MAEDVPAATNRKLGFECAACLAEAAHAVSALRVLDGDLADSDGAQYFERRHPGRFVQAGICEQNIVSVAAGMAAGGLLPWVFSFAAFLCYRAYDQIRVCVSQTRVPVVLVGSHAGGCGGRNGKTHAALNDVALMSTLPNIEVWSPADVHDVAAAVDSYLTRPRPLYLRLPRLGTPTLTDGTGRPQWIGRPTAVAFVSHGLSTHWAVEARCVLARRGIDVGVLHLPRIWPLENLLEGGQLATVRRAVVVEDHYPVGGLGTLLQAVGCAPNVDAVGWPIQWSGQSGGDEQLRAFAGLGAEQLARRVAADV